MALGKKDFILTDTEAYYTEHVLLLEESGVQGLVVIVHYRQQSKKRPFFLLSATDGSDPQLHAHRAIITLVVTHNSIYVFRMYFLIAYMSQSNSLFLFPSSPQSSVREHSAQNEEAKETGWTVTCMWFGLSRFWF